jgi:phosphate transport system permease protein
VRTTWRRLSDLGFWSLCALGLAVIVVPAVWIVVGLLRSALPLLDVRLLADDTAHLGLQNAILGTLVLDLGVLMIAAPVGVGAGLYLSEFAGRRLASTVRLFPEVLAGVPSIVVGYAGYVLLVVRFHWGYSLLAAVLALSALITPYVVKSTEVALRQVPTGLRDGARALGLPVTTTLRRVLLPPALPGIVNGVVVALAISTGETAPLLYTAGFSDANPAPSLLHHPVGYLTYVVYTDIQLPSAQMHQLANAAAAVTLVVLLALILVGRLLGRRSARWTARMSV